MTPAKKGLAVATALSAILMCLVLWSDIASEDEGLEPAIQESIERRHIKNSQEHFVCAGIGYIDMGSAFDGQSFYFRDKTRKLISACGGICSDASITPRYHCSKRCPPLLWKVMGCSWRYESWTSSNYSMQLTPKCGAADAGRQHGGRPPPVKPFCLGVGRKAVRIREGFTKSTNRVSRSSGLAPMPIT